MSADVLPRARKIASLAFASAVLGACSWFTDFKEQPKIDPWESSSDTIPFRGNPQNSVSVFGSAAPGYAVSRAALPATIDSMAGIPNPIPADARSLLNGRKYYAINCAVCHGYEGKGDGPVVAKGFPGIPLVGPGSPTPARTDGYIWGMIRNGRGLMPTYNRIEELDRWDVVNYVRGLQGKYTVATGPVGLPGETGDKVPGYSQTGPTRPSPYYKHAGSQAGPFGSSVGQAADSASRLPVDSTAAAGHGPDRAPAAAPGQAPTQAPTPAPSGAQPRTPMTPNTGGVR
jgi:mono/diheme cytochrome c family protein